MKNKKDDRLHTLLAPGSVVRYFDGCKTYCCTAYPYDNLIYSCRGPVYAKIKSSIYVSSGFGNCKFHRKKYFSRSAVPTN